MRKVTIIDVATKAGISKSTVSQYLNGRFSHMSKETKARIKSAIEELNYIPNPIARSLKTDKTKSIGVIVRDITGFNTSKVIRGIDDYCKKYGYNVLIYNTDFNPEIEAQSLATLKQLCVDGIIITSTGKNMHLIEQYVQNNFPLVQFQLEYNQFETNIVLSDYKDAAFKATEYLIQLGHNRICFLTQKFEQYQSRNERYQGYVSALKQYGIPIDEKLIHFWSREQGFAYSPSTIMQSSAAPTAFFTQHLAITTDLLKDLDRNNISIPNEVSVVGFDEIPMVEHFKVPITVIKQSPYKIGEESARLLINSLENKVIETSKIIVPCTLIKRQSCQALKH